MAAPKQKAVVESEAPEVRPKKSPRASNAVVLPNTVVVSDLDYLARVPGPLGAVHNILLKQSGTVHGNPLPASPELSELCSLIDSIVTGTGLQLNKDAINRALVNQPEKIEAVLAKLREVDLDRLKNWAITRKHTEDQVHLLCSNSKLSSTEYLAVFQLADAKIGEILTRLGTQTALQPLDSVEITEKIDAKSMTAQRHVKQRFVGCTPLGLEVVRKQLYALQKKVKANATKG